MIELFLFVLFSLALNKLPEWKQPRSVYAPFWFKWLPDWIHGITLYPFVCFRYINPPAKLIFHESVHLHQIKRDGLIVFYVKYLYFNWRDGYEMNPYEIEAREKTAGY